MPLEWTSNKPRFDADSVIVATPAETHYELAKEAISRGINVLIEKPMVMDVRQAEELYELAREKKVAGFVNHTHLYSPAWREMKKKIGCRKITSIVSYCGGPCKTDPKWDWGSHDISMSLDLGKDIPHQMFIYLERTPRKFIVGCGEETFIYDDLLTNPRPMDILITEFIAGCVRGDVSGIKMGLEVARILS